jgi:hypothetical protein
MAKVTKYSTCKMFGFKTPNEVYLQKSLVAVIAFTHSGQLITTLIS